MTILIKCLCTPLTWLIGVSYFIIALMMWELKYAERGASTMEDLWNDKFNI